MYTEFSLFHCFYFVVVVFLTMTKMGSASGRKNEMKKKEEGVSEGWVGRSGGLNPTEWNFKVHFVLRLFLVVFIVLPFFFFFSKIELKLDQHVGKYIWVTPCKLG